MKRVSLILTIILTLGSGLGFAQRSVGVRSRQPARVEKRVALVIGNSEYGRSMGRLINPANDAADMAAALRALDFQVTHLKDLNREGMENALDTFTETARGSDVALFYFAGHGVQVERVNYLVPIGARLKKQLHAKYRAVPANLVVDTMRDSGARARIVILDACRNNPLAKSGRSATKGLAEMKASAGTLIAFAAGPGEEADENPRGRNGLYTQELLKQMRTPGISIVEVFQRTRREVHRLSRQKQTPEDKNSLVGETIYLAGAGTPKQPDVVVNTQLRPNPPPLKKYDAEETLWQAIENSKAVEDFQDYLTAYPNGRFIVTARIKIRQLQRVAPRSDTRLAEEQRALAEARRRREIERRREAAIRKGSDARVRRGAATRLGGIYRIPASATRLVRSRRKDFGIWLDGSKWRVQTGKLNSDTMFEFRHRDGKAYAMVIAERITMPLQALRELAIKNVKAVGKNVRILSEETRNVNGIEMLMLKISAVIQNIQFVYFNYYYVGKIGSIQVITYTQKLNFYKYESELNNLLNGFVLLKQRNKKLNNTARAGIPKQSDGVSDPDGKYQKPANATRLVRSKRGDFGIWLDASKWRLQTKSKNSAAMFEFQHTRKDAYAMVIAERITMPLQALRKVAIDNVKAVGKNVRVVKEETRVVNGTEVLMLKIRAVIQNIPFYYYNYYYTGPIGSIQIITYTGANLFDEYKSDFDDLLNGFVILKK